jgi:hypothetical protein
MSNLTLSLGVAVESTQATSPTNCTVRRDIVLFSCLGNISPLQARFCPRTKISQNQALARQYILTTQATSTDQDQLSCLCGRL